MVDRFLRPSYLAPASLSHFGSKTKEARTGSGDSCSQAVQLSSAISTLSRVLATRKYRGRFMKGLNSAANIGLVYTELSTPGQKATRSCKPRKPAPSEAR